MTQSNDGTTPSGAAPCASLVSFLCAVLSAVDLALLEGMAGWHRPARRRRLKPPKGTHGRDALLAYYRTPAFATFLNDFADRLTVASPGRPRPRSFGDLTWLSSTPWLRRCAGCG